MVIGHKHGSDGESYDMNAIIKVIEKKVDELLKEGTSLLETLESFGWKDDRPYRIDARLEKQIDPSLQELFAERTVEIPAKARIPLNFIPVPSVVCRLLGDRRSEYTVSSQGVYSHTRRDILSP